MYATVLSDANFPAALLALDEELALAAQASGCRACGGRLHWARYPRKPRGGPWRLGPEHDVRHSFCCEREGCRRRTTPKSVRFLGRRVYLAAVVVLGTVLRHGVTALRVEQLSRLLGANRRTLERWRRWWTGERSMDITGLVPPVDRAGLPASLLDRFSGEPQQRLVALLLWLRDRLSLRSLRAG